MVADSNLTGYEQDDSLASSRCRIVGYKSRSVIVQGRQSFKWRQAQPPC
ncbi:hypothetical protein [Vibrio phage vB_pir03]|nr:hypothetical protein [Vibrio phage vB_pir03]